MEKVYINGETQSKVWKISRRDFIKGTGISALTLSLNTLSSKSHGAPQIEAAYPYRGWEDLYRDQWKWDKVVKGTHGFTNCTSSCNFNLYVKNGILWREEQTADYPPTNLELPDFNPRGCQKGTCFSENMYGAQRIKYPLKRVGERGEGKWKRLSWDEVLTEIADKIIDVIKKHGPDAIVSILGSMLDFGAQGAARVRFMETLGGTLIDDWGEQGDMNVGAIITWGHAHVDGTSDDWFNSDYIIFWTFNPVYTRIPDTHFFWEARYNGAQIISIAPDYNASSIHADLWINPKVGTDIALALGMANVIVNEKLYDVEYIKEQTDLPFLVREDTKRFLRERDLEEGGREDVFYSCDLNTGQIKKAPGSMGHEDKTLRLDGIDPALEGRREIKAADGKILKVRPVFELLKEMLLQYTPEKASQITGISPGIIKKLAHDYARAKSALIISSWGSNKFYHSDLMQRSRILLAALCGHVGKPGGGFRTLSLFSMEGFFDLSSFWVPTKEWKRKICSGTLWLYVHGEISRVSSKYGDPAMKRNSDEYVQESIEKGWMPIYPKPGKDPKLMIECGGNTLRKVRSNHLLRKYLWPKLDLIVDINYRMDSTALNSDIVLPAAGYYEKPTLKGSTSYIPFLHYTEKAVEPLFESKDEWEIHLLLAKKIQERAKEKGFTQYRDEGFDITRDLGNLYNTFTKDGLLEDRETVIKHVIENSTCTKGIALDELKERGFVRLTNAGGDIGPFRKTSEFKEGQALSPCQIYTEQKKPWATLTGRQQFYIDHDWFLEFGEELPVHKDPLQSGGEYPLRLTGGHTRWSIHSMWRDDRYMLRLQRGGPVMYMNDQDAKKRGIRENDYVRVYNDVNSFKIHAKPSPSVRPGQVIIYHAWEPSQFDQQVCFNTVIPTPLKPLQLVGNYGQLYYEAPYYQPNGVDRETLVEVEKV